MIRYSTRLFYCWKPQIVGFNALNVYQFGMLTDRFAKNQEKKSREQFKKEIQHMANKPSFTLMDYRQRILDELHKLKGSIRKKMSQQSQENEKALEDEKKILFCLFQEELTGEEFITFEKKKQISLITQQPIEKIHAIFKKAERYEKMHKVLRMIKANGEPLPETMQQLQYHYMNSGVQYSGRRGKLLKARMQQGHPSYLRKKRLRQIKSRNR